MTDAGGAAHVARDDETAGRPERSALRRSQNGRRVMRRLIDGRVLMLGLLCGVLGCGASGTDSQGDDGLTMAFIGFSGENIEQADVVTDTVAQVDICQDLCSSGGVDGDITVEPYTSTLVNAVFVNRGKADIVLESYTMFVEDSGVPEVTRNISARLIGGRCSGSDPEVQCGTNADCGLIGSCIHTETPVGILLFDFDFKDRVLRDGSCPFDVEPLTLDTILRFKGTDETGEGRTIRANYVATFTNFDSCDEQ